MAETTLTARELVERLFTDMASRDAEVFINALAEDAVFETPFPVPGIPSRLEGRAAIRAHLEQRWAESSGIDVHGLYPQVYETTDPELVIVENDVELTPPGGERQRIRTSVNVIRVRDGKVVLFRDYMSAPRLAEITAD